MTFPATSEVEAHSGALIATQDLVTYQSSGVVRGLTLRYNSLTHDPRPILHFRYSQVWNPNQVLIAKLSIQRGGFTYNLPGYTGTSYGLTGGEHLWKVPEYDSTNPLASAGVIDGVLQTNLTNQPSGRYNYTFRTGVQVYNPAALSFTALANQQQGSFTHINNRSSAFGRGWALVGWQELVVNPDNTVLLLDGDGTQLLFTPPSSGNIYTSEPGDFSRLERQSDGTFKRTLKDGTVYSFNSQRRLATVRDRNSNVTTYGYNASGQLVQIVDPVGLITQFNYTGSLVTSIVHPGPGTRTTLLEYSATTNNLIKLTHPDAAVYQYEYSDSRMTASIDAKGNRLEITYGRPNFNFGRVTQTVRKDSTGVVIQTNQIEPAAIKGLYPAAQTRDPLNPPPAFRPTTLDTLEAQSTDGKGNVTVMELNQRGDIVRARDSIGSLGGATYNAQNLVTQRTNGRGQTTNFEYSDGRGNVTRISDSISGVNGRQFEYEATFNQLTRVIDELGRQTVYDIDPANGNVRSITEPDPDGSGSQTAPVTQYTYTAQGLVDRVTDPLGRITNYEYNNIRGLIRVVLAEGTGDQAILQYSYDAAGNIAAFTDGRGSITRFYYDNFNRLTRVEQPDPDGTGTLSAPITRFFYDLNGNLIRVQDARNNSTEYEYDSLNRLVKITQPDPDGSGPLTRPVTIYEYDAAGNLQFVRDPLSRSTEYRYDARNRLSQVLNPLNEITTYGYDLDNNLTTLTDALNAITRLEYDPRNRLTQQTDGAGNLYKYQYDEVDNLRFFTDARQKVTTYTYDNLNRQITVKNPLNQTVTLGYDAVGNTTSVTDALNLRTQYQYDALNRQIKVIDARNGIVELTYDKASNLLSLKDPVNNLTLYEYDGLNRLITETNPVNLNRRYEYDPVGNLTKLTDRNNRVRNFKYDNLNRFTTEEWLDGAGAIIRTIAASYDAADQLTNLTDPAATYAYTYNTVGRLTSLSNAGTPNFPAVVLNATHNAVGSRLTLSETINGQAAATQTFTYNAVQWLTRITQSGTGIAPKQIGFGYTPNGQVNIVNRYASTNTSVPLVNTNLNLNDVLRLTRVLHKLGTTTLSDSTWTYDAAQRIRQMTSPDGTTTYTYDDTDQLTVADHSYQTDEAYSYDLNGNRTNTGYQTTTNNRLTNDGTFSYTYDNEGNRTRRTRTATGEVTNYTWDHRNRLTRVEVRPTAGGAVIRSAVYTYDAYDRRISKTVDPDGAGPNPATVERYIYDRDHLLLCFNGSNTLTNRYVYGPELDMVLVDERSASDLLWPLLDNQNTVRDLTNNAGAVQNHIRYDSFGNRTSQTNSSITTRYGYTGRELDSETGLYYYRSRYYDPAVGRFLSEDTIGFAGGDTNLYRYVGNSPVNFVDPWGLQETGEMQNPIVVIIGGIVYIFVAGVGWVVSRFLSPFNEGTLKPGPAWPPSTAPKVLPSAPPVPSPSPSQDEKKAPPDPNNCKGKKCEKTCANTHPDLIPCAKLPRIYYFPSAKEAANAAFPNGIPLQAAIAKKGPCSKDSGYTPGYHWNVKDIKTGDQLGSVGQCQCCEEEPEPHPKTKGAVLSSEPH